MRNAIEAAFRAACAEEIAALKPGNVHVHAAGHGMTSQDFLASAEASAPALCASGASLGGRILGAIVATREAVSMNTNLGIVLLCAPLAMAAEAETGGDLRDRVRDVCEGAGIDDAELVFRAIVLAAPGGLGDAAQHDVRAPARVPLLAAMAEARDRDRIAHQYVTGFGDVFGLALSVYQDTLRQWTDPVWATLAVYLEHLSAAPDSHIMRKRGKGAASQVMHAARSMRSRLMASKEPALLLPELASWDAALKREGLNPGTSADLTVASLFAQRLLSLLHSAGRDD